MESEEKDMTVIGEFRYVNHYFKIYEDGEIYVDYKPLGKVYADGDIWIARKRMGKIYADGEIWLANEKVGCLTPNKELWVNGKRVATGVGRPTNSKSSGNTASKSKGTSENKTYQTPKPPVTTGTGIPDMSGVEIAVFLVAICLAVSILYAITQIFLHGGLLGSTYRQYAGQSKLVDLLIYGIPTGFFALVTGLQCAFNHSFGVVLIEHAVSAFLEMCIFSWVTGYPLLAGTESIGFYILLILMLLIASLAPATVSTVIKKIIYWLKK